MNELNLGVKPIARIELTLTAILLIMGVVVVTEEGHELRAAGETVSLSFFLREILELTSLAGSFIALNFFVVPNLLRRKSMWVNAGVVGLCFLVIGAAYRDLDIAFLPLTIFLFYTVLKYSGLYLWVNADAIRGKYRFLAPGTLLAFVAWMISMFLFLVGDADVDAIVIWATLVPFGIFLYTFSFFSLIPKARTKRRPFLNYLLRVFFVLLIASFPLGFLALAISGNEDLFGIVIVVNIMGQLGIVAPFSWIVYKRTQQGNEQVESLQKELGVSVANLDLLKSQINPHFLFNALNTLYGTALQENAERTAESIQKLGDMMRFMLHENVQDKISINREVEYLQNYISLQRLRTDAHPDIEIQADIEQPVTFLQISPMLLIPFVENAFKHGISFRHPSHIRISLEILGNVLNFDVQNTTHTRQGHDPEKDRSGIGLENVRQRLRLFYPGRHELIIRETGKEFFVHLTIQLS